MTPFQFTLFLLPFLPLTLSTVSFPLTAIPHYSELSPCAVSHLSQNWNDPWYKGCSSETPISAYGSCLCVLRLSTLQNQISRDFQNDDDCSSNGVQAYLTAFCGQWGVDIRAAEKVEASRTTTVGNGGAAETGQATPGSTPSHSQPSTTASLPTNTDTASSNSSSGLSSDRIIAIAGTIAGIIAVVIAYLTYRHMKKHPPNAHHWYWLWNHTRTTNESHGRPPSEVHETQGLSVPGQYANERNEDGGMLRQGTRYK